MGKFRQIAGEKILIL